MKITFEEYITKIKRLVLDYDRDRYWSDSEYKAEIEPKLGESNRKQHELTIQFRNDHHTISEEDEQQIIPYLRESFDSALLVLHLLRVIPHFSENLMSELLQCAIKVRNPSANRYFIEPCLRVHGVFKVNGIMVNYVVNGSNEEKEGALMSFYWIRGLAIISRGGDYHNHEIMKKVYTWNGRFYKDDHEKTDDIDPYIDDYEKMRKDRMRTFLDVASQELDAAVLHSLFHELPEKAEDFDDEFVEDAKLLFSKKFRSEVLEIYKPLRALAGVSSKTERKKIHEEKRKEVSMLKKQVEEKIRKATL